MKEQGVLKIFDKTDSLSKVSNEAHKEVEQREKNDNLGIDALAEEQKSRKLGGFDAMTSNGSSIISARSEKLTDMGGPVKQIKTDVSNTIFDNNKLSILSNNIDSKLKTKADKEEISTNRRIAEQSRIDNLVTSLKEGEKPIISSIFRTETGYSDTSNYKSPSLNMSIFDNTNFERVPEKTVGEKVSEDVSIRRSQKDDSWKNNGKSISSKSISNDFFDNLVNNLGKND
jgi:regulator of replication initiation timing